MIIIQNKFYPPMHRTTKKADIDRLILQLQDASNQNPSLKCDCGNDTIIDIQNDEVEVNKATIGVEKYCCNKSIERIGNVIARKLAPAMQIIISKMQLL